MTDTPSPFSLPGGYDDPVAQLLSDMWDSNQALHDENRRLEVEVLAARAQLEGLTERYDNLALGIGHVGILVQIGLELADLQEKETITRDDLDPLLARVQEWLSQTNRRRPGRD